MAIGAVAQDVTVTGTVYDELNDPFPGVVIQPKDRPGVGITTDIDGNFSIKVQKKDVLVVSCLGYTTQQFDADEGHKTYKTKENKRKQKHIKSIH